MKDVVIAIIAGFFAGGGVAVALIGLLKDKLDFKRKRKAEKEDKEELKTEERLKAIESIVQTLAQSQKYILFDRIRFLGQEYVKNGEVDFDDRRILNDMHTVYHSKLPDGLGGNGDLDNLMKDVNSLPLKLK